MIWYSTVSSSTYIDKYIIKKVSKKMMIIIIVKVYRIASSSDISYLRKKLMNILFTYVDVPAATAEEEDSW